MVLMKNSAGNVYKVVPINRVDDMRHKGFIIVEDDGGGNAPPPTPLQDEPILETPVIVEESENPLMMNGLYVNQMNRAQMIAWMDREGLSYNKRGTKEDFLKVYSAYKKALKAK